MAFSGINKGGEHASALHQHSIFRCSCSATSTIRVQGSISHICGKFDALLLSDEVLVWVSRLIQFRGGKIAPGTY